ncbi:S8 family peptidase [Bacillus sp. B15-48]|uniref:S8 family peptidase n=1 Tax=Bacillus sp. B15-48 TaxID=1548601 RepID=UPI00193F598F|nr:S8 family peptidase [Bacillus sp. B15-48]MBM4763453.1 S8 family serine peptidase [Bacillus sp. B15-48]
MRTSKVILLTAVLAVLLIISINTLFQPETVQNRIQTHENEPIILNTNKKTHPQIMEINNIKRGKEIKQQLDYQQEITHFHHNKQDTSHYLDHEVTVQFKDEPEAEQLDQMAKRINGWVVKNDGLLYVFRSKNLETPELIEYFHSKEIVEFAEPQYILMQNEIPEQHQFTLPNDQLYMEDYQWNLPIIGTEHGWNISRGSEDVTIAVIDTGVDLDHPDLVNRLVEGYNVLGDNSFPDDDNGHGTHVAGIIASETNNREGTAGLTWFSKIMPIKAMGTEGFGTTFDIAKGIIWAVDHGADVLNLSLGNYKESNVLEKAIQYAYNHNVVIIAAAGNDATKQPSYPAAYPEVLSVSAVSIDGSLAEFSNYGNYINISAPGEYIPSTYFNEQYAALSGTSMAAPHVAGLAGLIKSTNRDLTNKEIMKIIQTSAIDLGKRGRDDQFGYGMIDVNEALKKASVKKQTNREKIQQRLNVHR